ncbi:MAG: SusC/RagA family TonB-linked outer membrane protein [Bacteroidetes bacterium]|nr:MAG: SusC/RagA family TonB-linked outer membrane protein [Bacteroidota bacterium]
MKRFTFLILMSLLPFGLMYAQSTIKGKVSDKTTNETLPGANIMVVGTTNGTVSDLDGNYTLQIPEGNRAIQVKFVGYQTSTRTISIAKGETITLDWALESDVNELEEFVVVGYGVQQKSVVTGAISGVKSKDLENMPISRLEQALQGRTSGVTIAASSGQPGASATVRVRGTTNFNNSDPLYVVDGTPVDVGGIDYLNAADIESIEILKDAASAAIYGTRAANGVIIVTTKKGSSGSMRVNYHTYFGTQSPAKKLDLLNATEYATIRNEMLTNANQQPLFANPDQYGEGTDWQAAIFNKSAMIQNHEFSINGGNDRSTYYMSFGYFDQEGIVATDISRYKRLNLRLNSSHKINEWLKVGNNFGYSHIKSKGSLNTNSEYGGPLASAINLDPITQLVIIDPAIANSTPYSDFPVVRDADGNPYGISPYVAQEMTNPLAYIATHLGNYGWSDNFVGNFYAELEPIKGLKLKSDIGTKLAFWGGEGFTPIAYLNSATSYVKTSFDRNQNQGLMWNWENTATYSRKFGRHDVSALIGSAAFVENSKGTSVSYKNVPVDNFEDASMNYSVADEDRIGSGWEGADHKVASLFGRLTYNYDQKYLFTGILRRDGSSRFGSNKKFGYFPSVSVGWVVSKEAFFPEIDWFNFLKIRGSYGVTGNDNIGDFRYLSTIGGGRNYTFNYDGYVVGYSPNAPANPDLEWEQTSQSNIGFEATLFNDVRITFDLYDKSTTGMLQPIQMPAYTGADDPTGNVASMTNKGIELELSYRFNVSDIEFDVKANGSYLKNEVTFISDDVDYRTGAGFQSSSYEISRLMVGQPIGVFYGFEVLGVFQSNGDIQNHLDADGNMIQPNAKPGDFKYADLNGDGAITSEDRTVIGDPTPNFSYGFTISAAWKGFDIMVFAQGVAGNDIYNGLRRLDITSANWTTDVLDRWQGVGTSNTFPRLVQGDPNKNFANPSTFHLTSGAYMRIKTMQVGYQLPKNVVQKIGLNNLRVYFGANNLFTFTQYSGYDPEIGGGSYGIDRGFYPQARTFMAGVNVGI